MKDPKHPGTSSKYDHFGSKDSGKSHGPSTKGSQETKLSCVHENKIVNKSGGDDNVRVAY